MIPIIPLSRHGVKKQKDGYKYIEDDRREARQSMLDAYPSLQKMYSADDGNTEVFYFKNATATFSSFTHVTEVVKF